MRDQPGLATSRSALISSSRGWDDPSYIAATARRHRLTVVTGSERDFRRPGVRVFNPFKELP
jgi:hypothetical protein